MKKKGGGGKGAFATVSCERAQKKKKTMAFISPNPVPEKFSALIIHVVNVIYRMGDAIAFCGGNFTKMTYCAIRTPLL